MPLYKTLTWRPGSELMLWQVDEPEGQLASGISLSDPCASRLDDMRSPAHRRAFLSIRHLLAHAGYTDHDLRYDEVGKPHLKDGRYISISHSGRFTGIVLSRDLPVGIDIEMQRPKIRRIARKFTTFRTHPVPDERQIRKLTVIWGAKEALYKILGMKGVSFLQHIDVAPFELADGRTTAWVEYGGGQRHYEVRFFEFHGYTCVHAFPTDKPVPDASIG